MTAAKPDIAPVATEYGWSTNAVASFLQNTTNSVPSAVKLWEEIELVLAHMPAIAVVAFWMVTAIPW